MAFFYGSLRASRREATSDETESKNGKRIRPKTKLGLPDLELAKATVLVSLRSPE